MRFEHLFERKGRGEFSFFLGSFAKQLRNWTRAADGSTAMMFAVAVPAILGSVGVATDFAFYNMKLLQLQSTADQAAIAAARELSLSSSSVATIEQVAKTYVAGTMPQTDSTIGTDVVVDDHAGTVRVEVKEFWTPFFAHYLGAEITPVVASATAMLSGESNICVLALEDSAPQALHMDKVAKLEANGCGVYSNSTHSQSIRLDADSSVKATLVCAAGGVKAKTTAVSPEPVTDCPKVADPLGGRPEPAVGGCDFTNIAYSSGSHVLMPGTYCNGLKITGTAAVTFDPGEYVVSGGNFEISGSAKVIAKNAGFYLAGEATTVQFSGDSSLDMTGALTGRLAGFLFFEDRSVSAGRNHVINSANAHRLTGTIYLPQGHLRVDPNAEVAQDSAFTAIIARTIEVNEGPTLVLNSNYDSTNVPVPDGIRASAQVVLSE